MRERFKLVFNWKFLFLTIVVISLGIYFGSKTGEDVAQQEVSQEQLYNEDFPPEARQSFIDSCVEVGSKDTYCTCLIDNIDSKYTIKEFEGFIKRMQEGDVPEEVVEIRRACNE